MSKAQSPKGPVVITGGNGFVGRYLQEELKRAWPGTSIVVWDLPDIDITKPETYRGRLKKLQPDWMVHLAAVSSVVAATKDRALTRRVNVDATRDLLTSVVELSPATRVFVTSTSDIYGQGSATPLPELPLEQAKPQNAYAQSKWEMEKIIRDQFADRVIRVRPFPHIGPGQGLGFVTADFASQIAAIESHFAPPAGGASRDKGRKTVIKVGNLRAKRDFTDVRDVVRAYRLLMERGMLGLVYHVASGKAVAIKEILDHLLRLSPVAISVQEDPERLRATDIPVLAGDATRLREATGWQPEIPLETSLRDILEWWRSQPSS